MAIVVPYNLNRLELRICDLVSDPIALLAITALLEARLHQLIADPHLDPLEISQLPAATRAEDLVAIADANEVAAAHASLDAELIDWRSGKPILARDWVEQLYQEVLPIAKKHGFSCFLLPLKKILREGNEAQRWLKQHRTRLGYASHRNVESIQTMQTQELALQDQLLSTNGGLGL